MWQSGAKGKDATDSRLRLPEATVLVCSEFALFVVFFFVGAGFLSRSFGMLPCEGALLPFVKCADSNSHSPFRSLRISPSFSRAARET